MPRFRNPVVSTANITDGSITTAKLADGAVTEPKVGAGAVTEAKLDALAVTAAKLANSAVTATKIANLAVGTAAIANAAIGSAKIAAAIQSDNFVSGSAGWRIRRDNGSAEFNDVLVRGDIESGNWNGASPANLSTVDTGATQGFYLDSSVGAAQFSGNVYIGGDLSINADALNGRIEFVSIDPNMEQTLGLTGGGDLELRAQNLFSPSVFSSIILDPTDGRMTFEANNDYTFLGPAELLATGGLKAPDWVWTGSSVEIELDHTGTPTTAIVFSEITDGARWAMPGVAGGRLDWTRVGTYDKLTISANDEVMILGGAEAARFLDVAVFLTGARNNTTASAANTLIQTADGRIFRSTSSERYKTAVRPWDRRHSVLELAPALYRSTSEGDDSRRVRLGLIAEEVAEVFPLAAVYHDGRPDGVDWNSVIVGLIAEVQSLEGRVAALEAA